MPDEAVVTGEGEGAATPSPQPAPKTITGMWENAEAALEKETAGQPEPAPDKAPEPPVDEPEHVKWAKRAQGLTNPETGEFDQDRILKQAFENHKQWQRWANESSQIRKILEHPEVAAAINRAYYGAPQQPSPPAAKAEEQEKSDEEILNEHIQRQAEAKIKPLEQTVELLTGKFIESEMSATKMRLDEAFGKDESGSPLYDSVRDEVGQVIAAMAQQAGMHPQVALRQLTVSGKLFDTLASAARNILWERQRAAKASAPAPQAGKPQPSTTKVTRLSPASRSSAPARSPKVVKSFADAVQAAEEELAQQGIKLQ